MREREPFFSAASSCLQQYIVISFARFPPLLSFALLIDRRLRCQPCRCVQNFGTLLQLQLQLGALTLATAPASHSLRRLVIPSTLSEVKVSLGPSKGGCHDTFLSFLPIRVFLKERGNTIIHSHPGSFPIHSGRTCYIFPSATNLFRSSLNITG